MTIYLGGVKFMKYIRISCRRFWHAVRANFLISFSLSLILNIGFLATQANWLNSKREGLLLLLVITMPRAGSIPGGASSFCIIWTHRKMASSSFSLPLRNLYGFAIFYVWISLVSFRNKYLILVCSYNKKCCNYWCFYAISGNCFIIAAAENKSYHLINSCLGKHSMTQA